MPEKSGAEILIDTLIEQGVDTVFGYPGGAVLPIYDALFQQTKIRHVLVRHEAGAAHAAEGYARSTGKPGVVLVTSGPGATNAVTGIATAGTSNENLGCDAFVVRAEYSSRLRFGVSGLSAQCNDISWSGGQDF